MQEKILTGGSLRQVLLCLALVGSACTAALPAEAQTQSALKKTFRNMDGDGYVFFARGRQTRDTGPEPYFHFGAGADAHNIVGIGLELGYLARTRTASKGTGVLSANFSYWPLEHKGKYRVNPFLTTGYSLFFSSRIQNRLNYGAGVVFWITERWGVRIEARDHAFFGTSPSLHSWEARVAFTFPLPD